MIIAGVGVYFFVLGGVRQSSFNKLLEEEDYTRDKKSTGKLRGAITICYWLIVTAIFLVFTYGPNGNAQPQSGWIIWAVAGVIYGGLAVLTDSVIGRKKNNFPKRGKQMSDVIEIKNLRKSFGEVKAVQDISFCVKQGEMFAFLGVNGAGKSTTISIICGYLAKDGGSVEVCGKSIDNSIDDIKRNIGVVFQNSVLDQSLSVSDNLRSRAAFYGIKGAEFKKRQAELAKMLDFEKLLNRTVGKLSGGQRRRIDIARALLHKPQLLILDEPTTGLDPQTRKLLGDVVADLRKKENLTVLLTTHYMEEAADADYVVILDSGKIVAEGTPLDLKNKYTGDFITIYRADENEVKKLGMPYEIIRDAIRISVPDTAAATRLITENPNMFTDYEVTKGKMDDVFLNVTGRKLTGGDEK